MFTKANIISLCAARRSWNCAPRLPPTWSLDQSPCSSRGCGDSNPPHPPMRMEGCFLLSSGVRISRRHQFLARSLPVFGDGKKRLWNLQIRVCNVTLILLKSNNKHRGLFDFVECFVHGNKGEIFLRFSKEFY